MKLRLLCVLLCIAMLFSLAGCVAKLPDVPIPTPDGETEGEATQTEGLTAETESEVAETEAGVTETEPGITETEPGITETEPVVTETEAEITETQPAVSETEAALTETQPVVTETEPAPTETEPEPTETETEPLPKTADILTPCLYLFQGQQYRLNYEAKNPSGEVDWVISTDCVTVDEEGWVTAQKEGYAIISAGEDSECRVKILSATMPQILVSTDGTPIDNKETYVDCMVSVYSETDTDEEYTFWYADAGIRLRGNSTMNAKKKPYRIKFDSKVNLLGMNEGAECKSWVLLAEWFDDSLIRNTAALSLAGSILDEYSSDWRYVRLAIDGKDLGVYVLAEQSQINKYRIDIEEAGADTPNLQSGYLYEVEGSKVDNGKYYVSYENLDIYTFLGNKYTVQSTDVQEDGQRRSGIFLELKNDDTSEEQKAFAEKYAQNIFKLIYAATYEGISYRMDENLDLIEMPGMPPEAAISEVVDIDSMARMYIFAELVCNFDAFKKSSYFYVDFSEDGTGKLTFACPWDHDRAFVKDWDAIEHVAYDEYFTAERSVFYVMMMNHDWFRAEVARIWEEVTTNSNSFQNARDMILDVGTIYAKDFAEEAELWDRTNPQAEWALATYEWLTLRIEWLNEQFTAMRAE